MNVHSCLFGVFQIMECILSASPNWYCSRIVDCSVNGAAVIGAKNAIDIWDICAEPARHVCRIDAHNERVVAVSLCNAVNSVPQKCCSAGEDCKVRVWNLENMELLYEHCRHKVCWLLIFWHLHLYIAHDNTQMSVDYMDLTNLWISVA